MTSNVDSFAIIHKRTDHPGCLSLYTLQLSRDLPRIKWDGVHVKPEISTMLLQRTEEIFFAFDNNLVSDFYQVDIMI